jgi:hypothetical protein
MVESSRRGYCHEATAHNHPRDRSPAVCAGLSGDRSVRGTIGQHGRCVRREGSSKSFAQTVEEIRNSINEGWRKLTNPKTVEPARDSVNEGWRKITDPKTIDPARQEVNKAWKGLSDAAGAAVGSEKKPQKETGDKKNK